MQVHTLLHKGERDLTEDVPSSILFLAQPLTYQK